VTEIEFNTRKLFETALKTWEMKTEEPPLQSLTPQMQSEQSSYPVVSLRSLSEVLPDFAEEKKEDEYKNQDPKSY